MSEISTLADALWRATCYVSVCQLHLRDNVLLRRPLAIEHVKERPSGHWGTVPGTAWAVSHLALAAGSPGQEVVLVPLLGAGHAGVVQLAAAWVTGDLGKVRSRFTPDAEGLRQLSQAFPDVDGLGAEVTPALPLGGFLGGKLGGCLPFAQGAALNAPDRVVVPILGDGECETPTTAGGWLAQRKLASASVLPVVHVNGFRMGDRSLLGSLDDEELHRYFAGLGWDTKIEHVVRGTRKEHTSFHKALQNALESTRWTTDCAGVAMREGMGRPRVARRTPSSGHPVHAQDSAEQSSHVSRTDEAAGRLACLVPAYGFVRRGRTCAGRAGGGHLLDSLGFSDITTRGTPKGASTSTAGSRRIFQRRGHRRYQAPCSEWGLRSPQPG